MTGGMGAAGFDVVGTKDGWVRSGLLALETRVARVVLVRPSRVLVVYDRVCDRRRGEESRIE